MPMVHHSGVGYHFGSFELNSARRRLLGNGEAVALGQRALDVLTALVERAGELVTREELLELAWPGVVVEENNLQVQVSSLRKIHRNDAIATSAGRGYRIVLEVARRDAPRPAAARRIEVIAVLPLENLNRQPSEECFADGMTESLITSISKVSGLKVIARNSVMRLKGSGESPAGIGRVLGAGAIVEGSVLRSGVRFRPRPRD
jgi:DNA-binding winged helix-turn-helix (wHTH) protein